jgi:pyridoxal phosphate-dependent aminotransferase EpsN
MTRRGRLYLSPPHLTGLERRYVEEAFASNWIAPAGPQIEAFEREFCEAVNCPHAVAVTSGTAALHLALLVLGIGPGDEVLVSTLTFAASVNPVLYVGATPCFIDSERASWNMDPALLQQALEARARSGKLPRAVIVVHLYGQSADLDAILGICQRYDIPPVEDAAEALGATYKGTAPGTRGLLGVYSFNGNKIITTSGGGMLVSRDAQLVFHARKLATQAREPAVHYQHAEVGYNYRMSNLLAAVGRGQLPFLEERVKARRRNFEAYREALGELPGIELMPEAPWGRHSRWLTCLTIDPLRFGADREAVRQALEREDIEARPLWKPMHLQPVFSRYPAFGGRVSEELFECGLCLPSGSSLEDEDLHRVVDVIRDVYSRAHPRAS